MDCKNLSFSFNRAKKNLKTEKMLNKLKEAKQKYKKGMYIISSTGNLVVPQLVHGKIRISENYPDCIVSDGCGVIYDNSTGVWAEIVIVKPVN